MGHVDLLDLSRLGEVLEFPLDVEDIGVRLLKYHD